MDAWAEWDDPVELRMRLDAALVELAELREENERLRSSLPDRPAEPDYRTDPAPRAAHAARSHPGGATPHEVDADAPLAAKVALFRSLFAGRRDVYARRYFSRKANRHAWAPAEKEYWRTKDDAEREFWPLTEEVLVQHLSPTPSGRELHVGVYPLLPDDTCCLLVCDFDGADWRQDAAAYHAACAENGITTAVEVSRSGRGAHVWMFFTAPVAAASARAVGLAMLRRAMARRGQMSLASYDRLFPAQDYLPSKASGPGRLGNLIALPLQGTCRRAGTTLFCDAASWRPYSDQFAFLAGLQRLSPAEVEELAHTLGRVEAGPTPTGRLPARPRRAALGTAPEVVEARLGALLAIATEELPASLVAALKHTASFHNPEFYRRQAMRYSTFATPRFVCCFDDIEAAHSAPDARLRCRTPKRPASPRSSP